MRGAVVGGAVLWAVACGGAGESLDPAPPPIERARPRPHPADAGPPAPAGTAIKLQTADGVLLVGTMWPGPKRVAGSEAPNGVVVFLHQLGSNRHEWDHYVPELLDRYTVVAIDLRGHGDSTKRVDGPDLDWNSFERADWALITNDVQAVVEYLSIVEPPDTPIALVGSSIGSSAALLYAATAPSVYSVVMLSPGLSYHGLDTQTALSRYGQRPILILAAEGDHSSAMATRRLAELAENRTVKVYKGDGHGVGMDGPVLDDVIAFLRQMPMRMPTPPLPHDEAEDDSEETD